MMAKLLSFLFLGILVALGYHLVLDIAYEHFFPNSLIYITYWYIPLLAVPALLLALLAHRLGLFRRVSWGDAAALLILIAITILTVGAPYSCWNGCF